MKKKHKELEKKQLEKNKNAIGPSNLNLNIFIV